MQNKLGILLRSELFKITGINQLRYEKDKKKKNRAIAMTIIIAFVIVVMGGYCFGFAYGFGMLGLSKTIPGYALTITALVILFFTFFKTNGVLFATKDYDMLMALPINTQTIITAKFLSMYLNNLFFAIIVMAPMGVGYAIWEGCTFPSVITWILTIFTAPLLPMTLAAMIGAIVMRIGAGAKHKVFVQVFLTVALMVGIFGTSFWAQGEAMQDKDAFIAMLTNLGATMSDMIHKIYIPSAWFDLALNKENILYAILFIAVSVLIYGVFVTLCSQSYRKINTALQSHYAVSNYKMGELKTNSVIMAIVKKEAKRFTSSTIYMTNVGMGLILALLATVGSLFIGVDRLLTMMGVPQSVNVINQISYIMPFGIAMIINMCSTTAVSLSLEGKNLWIVQSLPITRGTLLKGKMLFNIFLNLPVALLCSLVFIFELKVSVLMAFAYLLIAVTSVGFSTAFGMWVNLHFPNYEWENEVQVIKQGMSSMLAIFGSMLGYILLGILTFCLSMVVNGVLVIGVIGLILAFIGILFYKECIK